MNMPGGRQVIFLVCFVAFTTYDEDPETATDVNNVLIYYLGYAFPQLL